MIDAKDPMTTSPSLWRERYGERHRLHRLREMPMGLAPPRHVRIYRRGPADGRYLLQWWDRSQKRTRYQRINGDLVDALAAAREIDRQLADGSLQGSPRPVFVDAVIDRYLEDLNRRADAGQIASNTPRRYDSGRAALG